MILQGSKDTKKSSGYAWAEYTKHHKTRTVFYTRSKPNYKPLTTTLRHAKAISS